MVNLIGPQLTVLAIQILEIARSAPRSTIHQWQSSGEERGGGGGEKGGRGVEGRREGSVLDSVAHISHSRVPLVGLPLLQSQKFWCIPTLSIIPYVHMCMCECVHVCRCAWCMCEECTCTCVHVCMHCLCVCACVCV